MVGPPIREAERFLGRRVFVEAPRSQPISRFPRSWDRFNCPSLHSLPVRQLIAAGQFQSSVNNCEIEVLPDGARTVRLPVPRPSYQRGNPSFFSGAQAPQVEDPVVNPAMAVSTIFPQAPLVGRMSDTTDKARTIVVQRNTSEVAYDGLSSFLNRRIVSFLPFSPCSYTFPR